MATHDYVIANGTGAAVRSDLNNALAAIVSNNSSSSEPATTYAYQWWADTNANVLKIRNSANNAWITLRELDGTMLIEDGSASTPGLAFADDTNTGIFSPAADRIGFATGGASRLEIYGSEVVVNDPSNDVDFRVESNDNTHMLFVDAGNNRVGIGASAPAYIVCVDGAEPIVDLYNTNTTSSGSHSVTIQAYGASTTYWNKLAISGSSLELQTFGATRASITSDGLTFNGDTAAANALDDYEEGTFTPAFQSGITSPTFSARAGDYTKIGSLVTFTMHIQLSGGTNTSGQIIITDLPFTSNVSKQAGAATFAFASGLASDTTWPLDNNPTLYIGPNSNKIYFYATNGGTWNGNSAGGLSGRNMHIAGHYFV